MNKDFVKCSDTICCAKRHETAHKMTHLAIRRILFLCLSSPCVWMALPCLSVPCRPTLPPTHWCVLQPYLQLCQLPCQHHLAACTTVLHWELGEWEHSVKIKWNIITNQSSSPDLHLNLTKGLCSFTPNKVRNLFWDELALGKVPFQAPETRGLPEMPKKVCLLLLILFIFTLV